MYSPIKQLSSKDDERRSQKDKKKQQLSMLLINKFRNKFDINVSKEAYLDCIIKDEIFSLLSTGTTVDS